MVLASARRPSRSTGTASKPPARPGQPANTGPRDSITTSDPRSESALPPTLAQRNAVPLLKHVIRMLAVDTDLWTDATWVVDSTPVECARSREAARRSELAGWAGYGYCSSHSRFFWGLRLHLICTPAGLPVTWALANPKLDERQVLMAILDHDETVLHDRPGLLIIADKGYVSRELDAYLAERGVRLLRPNYRNRTPHPAQHLLKPVRQLIESVNDTLKGQLDLELHGGRTIDGVTARISQRLLALTAAIWHNRATGQPVTRSLIAYDH
ncbi:IS982 family transposase [Lentzea alba]|uniref:IS982 family transposase n=1 Tax=Lentzea alba TaxID=2714351 RepID=UPI0039BF37C3